MRIATCIAAALAAGISAACALSAASAQISDNAVKIGVLADQTGVFSSLAGRGSVVAARMAVEDFGNRIPGARIEVIAADHQNKADVGAQIARRWFDVEGVDMIVDVPNSSVVLAVQQLARERNRVLIASAGGTAALTGKSIPARRLGEAEDFGPLCAFLCSRRAGYITGQNVCVDGGLVRALI